MKIRTIFFRLTKWILLCFFLISISFVVIYKYLPVKYPNVILIHKAECLLKGKSTDVKHEWMPLDSMSSSILTCSVLAEDPKFWIHKGISIDGIKIAIEKNEKAGGIVAGGSTISQQTAKNVFLYSRRSWVRKGIELYFTFLEEWIWGKPRIFEVYLNTIELGDGVYGVESASKEYYGVSSRELTLEQSLYIACSICSPIKHNCKEPDRHLVESAIVVIDKMYKRNLITEEEHETTKAKLLKRLSI